MSFEIRCDRCDNITSTGFVVRIDRVIMDMADSDPINVNEFQDRPSYAFCRPCGDMVRNLLGASR